MGLVLCLQDCRPPVDRGFKNASLGHAKTEAEFVALLGPPGDYSTSRRTYEFFKVSDIPEVREIEWKDDYAAVVAAFLGDGGPVAYWNRAKAVPNMTDRLCCFREVED
ncbi:MAG: hypothetical protein C0467_16025 [Planctomycetaceae bacterium]|nr:hypothetical protein [Planctomycetaceae bacterium]